MVTGSGAMLVATGTQIAQCPLRVLLVGEKEEDFFLIREILERNRGMLPAELEHARSLDEAHCMLEQRPYDLILSKTKRAMRKRYSCSRNSITLAGRCLSFCSPRMPMKRRLPRSFLPA